MSNYSKFKDRAPQDTIFGIQCLLNEAGLFTTLVWVENEYAGAHSNRVSLYPTQLGTNGKGTDQLYATASAYAELMERIQNNLLAIRPAFSDRAVEGGYILQPDERVMAIDEVISQKDPFLSHLAKELNLPGDEALRAFLTGCATDLEHRGDGTILTVPYADLSANRVIWVPRILMTEIYGSNGMAAGNTLEEAMVQGISELYERYVNGKLLRGECVPPVIPDEALKPYSVWSLIEQIRATGRYSVTVFDCSLGIDLPVTATMITDLWKGTFSMKLGAHPSFAVSVERTLTESFQGQRLESMTVLCTIGSEDAAKGYHNIPNVMKIGSGTYPGKMFYGEPDWAFSPWTQWEGLDNHGFLKKMLGQLRQLGYPVLVRDASHLGFPSVSIVIPGFSEMYPINDMKFRSMHSVYRISDMIGRFPDLTAEEEGRFLLAIRFKEGSFIENSIGNLVMLPISGKRMSADRVGAFLALKRGEFGEAMRFFNKMRRVSDDPEEQLCLLCFAEYARYRGSGMDGEQAFKALRRMFRVDIAERVEAVAKDPATMLQKVFPKLNCPDCDHCELAGKDCLQPQEAEVFRRIKAAMSRSRVSQEALLERLVELENE